MMLFKRNRNEASSVTSLPAPHVQMRYPEPGKNAELEPEALGPVEDWLDAACAPLIGILSYTERQDLRSEMRQHLHSLVMAHREMGEPVDVAVEKSLRKFGDPETVARQWSLAGGKTSRRSRYRAGIGGQAHGIRVTLALCGLMGVFGFALRGALPGKLSTGNSHVQTQMKATPEGSVSPERMAMLLHGFKHSFAVQNIPCTSCHSSSIATINFYTDPTSGRIWGTDGRDPKGIRNAGTMRVLLNGSVEMLYSDQDVRPPAGGRAR
jgi:hypothetical protein